MQSPAFIPPRFDNLDFGERQALALAKEIHADFVLLDDKVARRFAESEALKVKGTLGIVADAAKAGLLNFRASVETLQQSTMHLEPQLAERSHCGIQKGADERFGQLMVGPVELDIIKIVRSIRRAIMARTI